MIIAEIKSTGTFINRPLYTKIIIDEKEYAIERKNENTGKFEKLTIRQLYEAFLNKNFYIKPKRAADDFTSPPPEDDANVIPSELFEQWFREKYLKNTGLESRVIEIKYTFK